MPFTVHILPQAEILFRQLGNITIMTNMVLMILKIRF